MHISRFSILVDSVRLICDYVGQALFSYVLFVGAKAFYYFSAALALVNVLAIEDESRKIVMFDIDLTRYLLNWYVILVLFASSLFVYGVISVCYWQYTSRLLKNSVPPFGLLFISIKRGMRIACATILLGAIFFGLPIAIKVLNAAVAEGSAYSAILSASLRSLDHFISYIFRYCRFYIFGFSSLILL